MERIFSTVEIYALWIYQFRGLVPNQFCSYWLWITTLVCIIAGILYRYFKNPYNYIDFDLEADLTGKVFAVTGASSGIGAEITRELYKRNAVVLMLVKEWKKGVKVTLTTSMITYINKEVAYIKKKDVKVKNEFTSTISSNGYITILNLDLTKMENIKRCAKNITRYITELDGLFNNAGIGAMRHRIITENNMETVQQVNAIGHLALTLLLLPSLKACRGRVVASSSVMSKAGGSLDVNDISYMCGKYCGVQAYARSKLLINLLTAKLAQLYANDGVRFFAGDPGITHTPIGNAFISYFFGENCPDVIRMFCNQVYSVIARTPNKAALRIIGLGFSSAFDSESGNYFENYRRCDAQWMMTSERKIDAVWTAVQEQLMLCGFYGDVIPLEVDSTDYEEEESQDKSEDDNEEVATRRISAIGDCGNKFRRKKRFMNSIRNLFSRPSR